MNPHGGGDILDQTSRFIIFVSCTLVYRRLRIYGESAALEQPVSTMKDFQTETEPPRRYEPGLSKSVRQRGAA